MTPIRTYLDLQQFAGKAIAYQSVKDFGEYSLQKEPSLKFGTLSDNQEGFGDFLRFDLYHFLDSINGKQMQTELFNGSIYQLSLKMRAAFPSEIEQLQNAVSSGKAMHYQDSYTSLDWKNLKELAKKHFDSQIMFFLGSKKDPNSSLKVFPPEIITKILTSA